jgi:hypothetical protein
MALFEFFFAIPSQCAVVASANTSILLLVSGYNCVLFYPSRSFLFKYAGIIEKQPIT